MQNNPYKQNRNDIKSNFGSTHLSSMEPKLNRTAAIHTVETKAEVSAAKQYKSQQTPSKPAEAEFQFSRSRSGKTRRSRKDVSNAHSFSSTP